MEYKIEQITIAGAMIDRIEQNGVYWYPLRAFFRRVLLKKEVTTIYRDSNLIKYMKTFTYKPYNVPNEVTGWFMNEEGIRYILPKMHVKEYKNNKTLTKNRKKCLSEACLYFGLEPLESVSTKYISQTPNLDMYDIWSLLCLQYDNKITNNTIWKKCKKCNYYYPDNFRYYSYSKNHTLKDTCKTCSGFKFKCQNKVIQFFYDNGGLDLLLAYYNKDIQKVYEELNNVIEGNKS